MCVCLGVSFVGSCFTFSRINYKICLHYPTISFSSSVSTLCYNFFLLIFVLLSKKLIFACSASTATNIFSVFCFSLAQKTTITDQLRARGTKIGVTPKSQRNRKRNPNVPIQLMCRRCFDSSSSSTSSSKLSLA